jgi:exodeoxyribonuclease VII small subunit
MDEQNDSPSFEESLHELEKIVARMEQGENSLEGLLSSYEKGAKHAMNCQKRLLDAEKRIEKVKKDTSGLLTETISPMAE